MVTKLIEHLRGNKMSRDTLFSLTAMIISAGCGALIHFIIGAYYNPAALGVFNQVFAVYIFFSQAAVFGVHNSILKYTAQYNGTSERVRAIAFSGLALTTGTSLLFVMLYWLSRGLIGRSLDSPEVAVGMAYAAFGLFFFSLNKTLLALLNGLRQIKMHAALTAARFVFMTLALIVACLVKAQAHSLAVILSAAEAMLFICLLPATFSWLKPVRGWSGWLVRHLEFGVKSLPSGVLVELNTRVDVLMLGYFQGDALVGIYSLAAITVEVAYQALIALRINVNPVLVRLISIDDPEPLSTFIAKYKKYAYFGMTAVGAVGIIGFWATLHTVPFLSEYGPSLGVFVILMIGLILSAGYVPFNQILMQAGRPGWHTVIFSTAVLFNAAANGALIPRFGINGAAIATGLSFIASVFILTLACRRLIGVRL